jgi:hypothetical protein
MIMESEAIFLPVPLEYEVMSWEKVRGGRRLTAISLAI